MMEKLLDFVEYLITPLGEIIVFFFVLITRGEKVKRFCPFCKSTLCTYQFKCKRCRCPGWNEYFRY